MHRAAENRVNFGWRKCGRKHCFLKPWRILNLTILNSTSSEQSISACDSYFWPINGSIYTASGTYTDSVRNSAGCDAIVMINLTVNQSDVSTMNVNACGNYLWAENGLTYSTSGTYSVTYTNLSGCDSTIVLNLSLGQNTTTNVKEGTNTGEPNVRTTVVKCVMGAAGHTTRAQTRIWQRWHRPTSCEAPRSNVEHGTSGVHLFIT